MGLLGFGGDRNDSYRAMLEISAAYLLHRQLVAGVDIRQINAGEAFHFQLDEFYRSCCRTTRTTSNGNGLPDRRTAAFFSVTIKT